MGFIRADGPAEPGFVPKMEISVRELFAQEAARLGYRIVESRASFPDYILEHAGKRLFAEAEFRSSDFLRHRHDFARCDLLVVWEHDLPYLPVPVLELQSLSVHDVKQRRTISPGRLSGPTSHPPEKRSGKRLRRRLRR